MRAEPPLPPRCPPLFPPSLLLLLALATALGSPRDAAAQERGSVHIALPMSRMAYDEDTAQVLRDNLNKLCANVSETLNIQCARYIFTNEEDTKKRPPKFVIESSKAQGKEQHKWPSLIPPLKSSLDNSHPSEPIDPGKIKADISNFNQYIAEKSKNKSNEFSIADQIFYFIYISKGSCLTQSGDYDNDNCSVILAASSAESKPVHHLRISLRRLLRDIPRIFFQEVRKDKLEIVLPKQGNREWKYVFPEQSPRPVGAEPIELFADYNPLPTTDQAIPRHSKHGRSLVSIELIEGRAASLQPLYCQIDISALRDAPLTTNTLSCDLKRRVQHKSILHYAGISISLVGLALLVPAILTHRYYGSVAASPDWATAGAYRSAGYIDNTATWATLFTLGGVTAAAGTSVFLYGFFGKRDINATIAEIKE